MGSPTFSTPTLVPCVTIRSAVHENRWWLKGFSPSARTLLATEGTFLTFGTAVELSLSPSLKGPSTLLTEQVQHDLFLWISTAAGTTRSWLRDNTRNQGCWRVS